MKLPFLIKLFCFILLWGICHVAVYAELVPGKGQILWTENFLPPLAEDPTAVAGWSFIARQATRPNIQVAVEGKRARLWNVSAKHMTAFGRYIPLYPERITKIKAKVIYQQLRVTRIGEQPVMCLLPGGTWISGNHPGIYTFPYMRILSGKPLPAKKYYRIDLFNRGYVEVEFLRLVRGLPPLGVIWKRSGDPAWNKPIKPGEKITLEARLGKTDVPVTVEFFRISFNVFRKTDLLKNSFALVKMYDNGRNGDRKAGDGIWTLQFKVVSSAMHKAKTIAAKINFGKSNKAKAYGFSPWPFKK
ncbi:MAG: hypothetical protein L3J71_09380 [Victivallaceae bacterium]|nr:hypothetical protein [Victivallaceae bacterium]